MSPRRAEHDGTMSPVFHDSNELIDREPVVFKFSQKGVRPRARRKSAETRTVRAFLKRLDKEKEQRP